MAEKPADTPAEKPDILALASRMGKRVSEEKLLLLQETCHV